jgi:hypothetical protein
MLHRTCLTELVREYIVNIGIDDSRAHGSKHALQQKIRVHHVLDGVGSDFYTKVVFIST